MIPDSFIEELKHVADIEQTVSSYVSLKRKGRHLSGLCPFHSEKTASFTVYPDSQSYYCFGCGNGGDVITFIRNIENLDYIEALKFLAGKAGLAMPEDKTDDKAARLKMRILEINRETARFYHSCLTSDAGKNALEYLTGRGLTMKTIRTFGLGFSPGSWDSLLTYLQGKGYSPFEMEAACVVRQGKSGGYYDQFRERVMFPIIDLRGNVIGFGGRSMGDNGPKYLNSPDTPVFKKSRNLFALNFAKSSKTGMLILGEGYMDVISMHQAGFTNAVATLGTSLTEEQSRLISQYAKRVVIAYDSDGAGQTATKRAINLFSQLDVAVSVLEMKDAKDPDEFIQKFGRERFEMLLTSGKSAMDFEITKLKKIHDTGTSEGAVAFLNDFCKLMAGVENEIERGVYIAGTARELDIDKKSIVSTVESLRKKKYAAFRKKDAHNLRVYAQDNAGSRVKPRGEQLEGLVAEDRMLVMLMKNPDFFERVSETISADDFGNSDNREIYAAISEKMRLGQPLEIIYLSELLTSGQVAKLTGLLAKNRDLHFAPEQAGEFAAAMKRQKQKKSDEDLKNMTTEELAKYLLENKKQQK